MPRLFKYFSNEEHAIALVEKGEVYMQTLSSFRSYEDDDVRRDTADGKLRYKPTDGLTLTKENGDIVQMPADWSFVSSVKDEDVYVFCLSTQFSDEIACRFQSRFCVEIETSGRLIGAIRQKVAIRSQLDSKHVLYGPVAYRSLEDLPQADWALPERVAFIKPREWAWQREYRIIVGKKGVFAPENVVLTLTKDEGVSSLPKNAEPLTLCVGNLSRWAKIREFNI